MHAVRIYNHRYALPSSWEELTEAQLLKVAPVVFGQAETPVAKWQVLKILMPFRLRSDQHLSEEEIYDLVQCIEWLWRKDMTHCPVQEFTYHGATYRLPEPDFNNVCIIEYAMADRYMRNFFAQPDLDHERSKEAQLNQFVATLCRPLKLASDMQHPDWDGDRRQKYNSALADARAGHFSRLSIAIKIVVLRYFISRQKMIHEKYGPVFKKSDDPKENGKAEEQNQFITLGWIGVILNLAEQGTFGDWEKTCYTPLHTILVYLYKKQLAKLHAA